MLTPSSVFTYWMRGSMSQPFYDMEGLSFSSGILPSAATVPSADELPYTEMAFTIDNSARSTPPAPFRHANERQAREIDVQRLLGHSTSAMLRWYTRHGFSSPSLEARYDSRSVQSAETLCPKRGGATSRFDVDRGIVIPSLVDPRRGYNHYRC